MLLKDVCHSRNLSYLLVGKLAFCFVIGHWVVNTGFICSLFWDRCKPFMEKTSRISAFFCRWNCSYTSFCCHHLSGTLIWFPISNNTLYVIYNLTWRRIIGRKHLLVLYVSLRPQPFKCYMAAIITYRVNVTIPGAPEALLIVWKQSNVSWPSWQIQDVLGQLCSCSHYMSLEHLLPQPRGETIAWKNITGNSSAHHLLLCTGRKRQEGDIAKVDELVRNPCG